MSWWKTDDEDKDARIGTPQLALIVLGLGLEVARRVYNYLEGESIDTDHQMEE